MWNQIYSASIWTPNGNAIPSEVKSTKTFYSTSRTLQTGQLAANPTPTPVTPVVGDASRINTIFKEITTLSYGSTAASTWGDWGSMWNRIYSASIWAPNGNATTADVVAGRTFYSNSRTLLTGISLVNGTVCVNNSDCFTGTCTTFYQDSDSDTYGNNSVTTKRCGTTYTGYVTNNTDCNDASSTVHTTSIAGGTITTSGGYKIHTFTGSGTLTVSCPSSISTQYLVVAGGGGGGSNGDDRDGGGGGAGGYLTGNISISSGNYSIVVGAGGGPGTSGNNSVFASLTAIGGGRGGGPGNGAPAVGGSGGGTSHSGIAAAGTSGQGNAGGNGSTFGTYPFNGGGGGGAGGTGISGNSGSTGGVGLSNSISGVSKYYAGGGGGGTNGGTNGAGGTGGGGAGGFDGGGPIPNSGIAGTANTGGGGGGSGGFNSWGVGGAGGSGIVIVRYLDP